MSDLKVLHTGDLHIGSSRTSVKNGRAEIINTFFRIVDICKSEKVDFLLIAGDLFDTPFTDGEIVSEIIQAMSEIPETIIAISPGNHDCACPGSVWLKYEFPKNVLVFTSFLEYCDFEEKNVRLFGAAFTDRFARIPLLSEKPELSHEMINLCVLHGDLSSRPGESDYNPITTESIRNCGFDYLALGHVHKRSFIEKLGNTFFSYCGCPDGRGFDEDGSHGVYLGTVSKGKCNLEYLELSSRKYIIDEIDISHCDTSISISAKILEHIKWKYSPDFKNNLYRISLTGMVSTDFIPNVAQIESSVGSEVEFIRITDKTDPDLSNLSAIATESSLRGIFVQKMLEMMENADESQKELHSEAIRLGLKSFERGVTLNDN